MPLRIFSSRAVSGSNLVQVLGTAGMFGMFFLGSLYLRRILGYGPLQIGLAFLPVAVVMGALSVSARPPGRRGADRRLPPGILDRVRPGGGGHRGRRDRAPPGCARSRSRFCGAGHDRGQQGPGNGASQHAIRADQ
jgi:hypothetical protein